MRRITSIFVLFTLLLVISSVTAFSQAKTAGRNGMVASVSDIASKVGVEILKKGGNAVDAAVAVHMALAVTHPQAGNTGGGGFFVIHLAKENKNITVDFREKAPGAGHRDMYLDEKGNVIPNASSLGYRAVGVPGAVAGCFLTHQKYGSLKWKELVEPAYLLAKDGFKVGYHLANAFKYREKTFSKFPSSAKIFLKNGTAYGFQETWKQPDLATTLKLVMEKGRDGFYKGTTAEKIVADMKKNGGLISMKDLENYQAVIRKPIAFTFKGYRVISMPPPSSGGILIKQMLGILENYDLKSLGHNSSRYIHLLTEVEKLAYADRAEFLGDSDFYDVPIQHITSPEYIKSRGELVNLKKATPSSEISNGPAPAKESPDTTHFSVVDKWGNAVSCTTTLNSTFGSKVVAEGTGILLNNEMDDFSIKPGVPNNYGLIGGEANAIAPGKRMLSSMTPTIVLANDKVKLVVGAPGGSTIITTVMQGILNAVIFDQPVDRIVSSPRFHHQWMPDKTVVEKTGTALDVIEILKSMGHNISMTSGLGRMYAILVEAETGILMGASDPRAAGSAEGF